MKDAGTTTETDREQGSNMAVNLATGVMPVLESKSHIKGPIDIIDRPGLSQLVMLGVQIM
jgi:hypothetical protein